MDSTATQGLRPGDPAHIGPYRLLGRLGEGGMGTVYLGSDEQGRLVAVKVVRQGLDGEGFAARFHAEVAGARRVASFCTARVLDDGTAENGRPYMVTEYIPGTPLSRQVATHGPLEPGQLHGVAVGVATALAAIHVAGLVHRDLKPANVILSMSGPRVIDFGIARVMDAAQGPTRAGEVLGSPGWWAPEQVNGDPVGPWTDIFAWGCLVAYAGTGRHPFGRGDAALLAARVLTGPPDLEGLPAPLDDLAARATDRDPSVRPGAQELMIALVGGDLSGPRTAQVREGAVTAALTRSWDPPANVAEDATRIADVVPAQAPPSRRVNRWTLGIVAAVLALAASVAVLVRVIPSGRGDVPTTAGAASGSASAGPEEPASSASVGVGEWAKIDGTPLRFLIAEAPNCEWTSYGDTPSAQGRFCVLKWALKNDASEDASVEASTVTLVDDQGSEYGPSDVSDPAPTSVSALSSVEGFMVFDMPSGRTPARLTLAGGAVEITF